MVGGTSYLQTAPLTVDRDSVLLVGKSPLLLNTTWNEEAGAICKTRSRFRELLAEAIEIEIYDGRGEQSEHLANQQTAHDRNSQRPT